MKLIKALEEIAESFRERPYTMALSLSMVGLVLLIMRASGADISRGAPAIFACWLLGVHIGNRIINK